LITGGTALSLVFLPIPAMIGYSDLTSVYTPKEKSNSAFMYLLIYSLVLLGLAIGAEYLPRMELVAALFAGLGHEAIYKISHRKEDKLPDKFVHPSDGLRVLAVIPGSLADRMGIVSGEIIKKVNGTPVATREELYYALQKQSAFTKLEIINLAGYLKFAQHSIYANDHHQLGIILAPDDQAKFFIETAETNLFSLIKQQVKKIIVGRVKDNRCQKSSLRLGASQVFSLGRHGKTRGRFPCLFLTSNIPRLTTSTAVSLVF